MAYRMFGGKRRGAQASQPRASAFGACNTTQPFTATYDAPDVCDIGLELSAITGGS